MKPKVLLGLAAWFLIGNVLGIGLVQILFGSFLMRRAVISIAFLLSGLFCAFRSSSLSVGVIGGFILIGLGLLTWWTTFLFPIT